MQWDFYLGMAVIGVAIITFIVIAFNSPLKSDSGENRIDWISIEEAARKDYSISDWHGYYTVPDAFVNAGESNVSLTIGRKGKRMALMAESNRDELTAIVLRNKVYFLNQDKADEMEKWLTENEPFVNSKEGYRRAYAG